MFNWSTRWQHREFKTPVCAWVTCLYAYIHVHTTRTLCIVVLKPGIWLTVQKQSLYSTVHISLILHVCTQLWVDISRSPLRVAKTTEYANLVKGGIIAPHPTPPPAQKIKCSVSYFGIDASRIDRVWQGYAKTLASLCSFSDTRLIKIKAKSPWMTPVWWRRFCQA